MGVGFSTFKEQTILSIGGDLFVTMELLVVTFVFATTILSVPAEAGPSGYRHKTAVASVPVDPVARPYYGKRSAQVAYQGLLEEKDHIFGKRSVAVYPEVDESNTDNFLGRRAAPGPTGCLGKREAARYPYKREAAESLEVGESNADYDYDYKEGALAWPTGNRHHAGKSSLPAEKLNFAQYGKRAAPTSMEAEYSLEAEYDSYY